MQNLLRQAQLWRGGLGGGQGRPKANRGMFGPSVRVAADERGIRDAIGRFLENGLPMTILVVAPIVATAPFKVTAQNNEVGLSVVGLGQQPIYVDFDAAGQNGLFEIDGVDRVLISDLAVGGRAASSTRPTSVFYLSSVDDVTIRNIGESTSTAAATTNFLSTNIALTGLRVYGCNTTLPLSYSSTDSAIFGNTCDDITVGSLSSNNRVFGNRMGDGVDSASSGNNTLFGNTGNGSHTWTGTGSTSNGDNT